MKILRVISSMHPSKGGPCQGIRNIIPYFQKEGVITEVVCMDDATSNYPIVDDFTIYKVGIGKTSYQYQSELSNWLKENILNYDAVVVHGLWQYHNLAVYNVIKKLKKRGQKVPKVVVLPHGMLDPYFQKAPDRKMKAIRNEIIWHLTEKKCINTADAIFFTCQEEMRLAATTFKGYNPNKTINVGYGIQAPPLKNVEFKHAFEEICSAVVGKKYWLFLSRIHEKKGVDLLIQAYDKLSRLNPSLPELVIAGPTTSDYAQQMIKLASNNTKIHFPGMLQGAEKWGAFYGCQAYFLPSYQENFGIAIVEAMACEKPVMVSKNVNIWKEIKAGNGGWILDDLSDKGIYSALLEISEISEENIAIKGNQSYTTFQNNFNVQDRAAVFLSALNQL
ncbi:glycosyltransferase [Flavobacterium sp. WC2421]|uniref:glycosyltransferase n=1 Tax=Flavobacterium sp. WC2421 TaxID=3234138 RepID=UPI003466F008